MADVISRQAAIDEVNRLAEFFWEKWHEYAPSTIAVTDALKEIPSAQQWIPCSERLPEKGVIVLAQAANGYMTTNKRVDFDNHETWFRAGNYVAWMPLPEPYKEETDDLQK